MLILGMLFYLISCKYFCPIEIADNPTSGNIKISVDESFQPIIDTQVYTFTALYKRAFIKAEYKPEVDVVNDFMNDSVKVMVPAENCLTISCSFCVTTLLSDVQ